MPSLPYKEVIRLLEETSEKFQQGGTYLVNRHLAAPYVMSFTASDGFVLVKVTDLGAEGSSRIMIIGGGAKGSRPEAKLFQHLLSRTLDFDWGGPFARQYPDGVTFGHRVTIPSEVITMENIRNSIDYIYGMIDVVGRIGRITAEELVPEFGGEIFDGSNPWDDSKSLLATVMM
jgi:hypothetical protein